ncbi:hypothetical protein N7462_010153 [Penicillium macrosclerotiorum]|uniref:uncharacterized protein n=1 Tax=Penicillium macrosclerotiorum TaxID=303699 RepID=UPI0025483587|nr:uncharacterized protein N7462_010153 [Penicillium macrosclerotiorum]KAJ5669083.1 hypothetical protein N7462_010153 [Penicillium macrosclerotiorum]
MRYLLPVLAGAAAAAAVPLAHRASTTYFFTFGDSYTMTSFNDQGTQPSASNPMGNPTLGTGATGGGINWVGYLTTVDNASLVLSYNLAVGGATIDNSIINAGVEDMTTQVADFQGTYSKKPSSAPWTSSDGVFGFWIGINDVGWDFSSTNASVIVPELMAQYKSLIEEIYSDGGRKFLFLNVPSVSRSPYILDQGESVSELHAAWTTVFNNGLSAMIKDFKTNHKDVVTVLYDSWTFMTGILDNPTAYGYPDATCIDDDGESCVWWNNYHPGQKYHRLQAADMKKYLQPLGGW